MSGLRIAHFSNFSPKKLGTGESRIVALAKEARSRGHTFALFGRDPVHPEVSAALKEAGATWQSLDTIESAPFRSSRWLARHFDVIQLNLIAPRSRLAFAAFAAYPAIVLFVDRVSRPPATEEISRPVYKKLLDRLSMVRVRELAGITDFVRDRARQRYGLDRSRVRTIYNGVDVQRFRPPDASQSQDESKLSIVTVAALIPYKGVDVLLRAAAAAQIEFELSIVGEGPERSALEGYAKELEISNRVRFLGLRDDVAEIVAAADILVHPAIWQEALGNTVLEGMACGRCVVASSVGGIPELIENEKHGILFKAGDSEALADILTKVGNDKELRDRLGRAARERVLNHFTLRQSIAGHLDWYEESARSKRPRRRNESNLD